MPVPSITREICSCEMLRYEPLYSNSIVIADWLQSMRVQNIPFPVPAVKKGNIFVNILFLKIVFAFIQLCLCLSKICWS